MSKKRETKKRGWASLEAEAKKYKSLLKKLERLCEVLPEDIAKDPKAVMEWLRRRRAQKRRFK